MYKKIIALSLISAMLFSGCTSIANDRSEENGQVSSFTGYDIDLDNGTIKVTPEQFISDYNTAVSNFMETSDDAKAQYLDLIPDFVASGEDIDINDDLSIAFEVSDDGLISQIDLNWYSIGISDRNALNIGFITAALPSFICTESSFDLTEMIDAQKTDKKTDTTANLVYGMGYAYGAYSVYIKPLNFGE